MRVLVNGCSHLAGTELADIDEHSRQLTWPNYVANWEVTNISLPASSNDSITRRTIDELQSRSYDMVFVQWTYFDRIELQIPFYENYHCQKEWFCINGQNAKKKFPLNNNDDLIFEIAQSIYFKQFNMQWFENYSLSNMITLQYFLEKNKIPYCFGFVGPETLNFSGPRAGLLKKEKFLNLTWVDFCQKKQFQKIVSHYELAAHLEFAKYIESLNLQGT
jgi:hypothetical protein